MTPLLLLLLCSLAKTEFSTLLIGGTDPYDMLDSVEVVTTVNKTCTHSVTNFPLLRYGLAAAHLSFPFSNDILACGGENRGPWGTSRQACYHFRSSEDRWIEAPPMNFPRFDATIHTFESGLPAQPGFNLVLGGGESAVEILPGGGAGGWTEVEAARLPYYTFQGSCSVVVTSSTSAYTSYIHLLGGQEDGTSWATNSHYRLKVDSNGVSNDGWELMHHMPLALQDHGCLAADIGQTSGIIVTGGYDELSMGFSNKAFFYDIELEHWTELRELPQPRAFHNMGLIGEGVG